MNDSQSHYAHTSAISGYRENALLKVPGLADLHRMTTLLLRERASVDAHILVVGAGGGMETLALGESQPGWSFVGVDPAAAMLDLARQTVAPIADRVELIEGSASQAPEGPFDGATCLLTLHHIERAERLRTLQEIRRRLKPGARLVIAGHSAPGPDPQEWMIRSVAFGDREAYDRDKSTVTAQRMTDRLPLLTPDEEQAMLHDAGFEDVELFYAALSFRGWVASTPFD